MLTDEERRIAKIKALKEHLCNGGYLYQLKYADEAFKFMVENADDFKDLKFKKRCL